MTQIGLLEVRSQKSEVRNKGVEYRRMKDKGRRTKRNNNLHSLSSFVSRLSCFLLLASCLLLLPSESLAEEDTPQNPNYVFSVCKGVVDGNTIEVDILGMKKQLRLIGIDVGKGIFGIIKGRLGMGAVGYLEKTVKGKKLYLEFEDNWTDPSGILRGYVHLKEEGTFINLEMIKMGYASADKKSKYKYRSNFEKAEKGGK